MHWRAGSWRSENSAFLHILFKEGRGVGLCWAHSQPKGPKGPAHVNGDRRGPSSDALVLVGSCDEGRLTTPSLSFTSPYIDWCLAHDRTVPKQVPALAQYASILARARELVSQVSDPHPSNSLQKNSPLTLTPKTRKSAPPTTLSCIAQVSDTREGSPEAGCVVQIVRTCAVWQGARLSEAGDAVKVLEAWEVPPAPHLVLGLLGGVIAPSREAEP
jgi:hypothetical protein